jgi:serine protease AprX
MPTSDSGYRLIAPPSRPRRYRRARSLLAAALCVAVIGLPGASSALADADNDGDVTQDTTPVPAVAKMDSDLRLALANTPPGDMVTVIIHLTEQVNLTDLLDEAIREGETDAEAREEIIRSLQQQANEEQLILRVLSLFWALGGQLERITPYWIFNGMAVTATPDVIWKMAARPEVDRVEPNATIIRTGLAQPSTPQAWGVDQIGATAAHTQGYTGAGVVVASLDSGADIDGLGATFPSTIAPNWRGGTNSWFDPYSGTTRPYDLTGHGTAVLSIIAGADPSGEAMGVAPGAQWIAAKIFDDSGAATTEAVHASFQWILDPDGDPGSDDGADIVNNSWGAWRHHRRRDQRGSTANRDIRRCRPRRGNVFGGQRSARTKP